MSELRFLESGFGEPLPWLPDLQAQRHANPLKIRKPRHPILVFTMRITRINQKILAVKYALSKKSLKTRQHFAMKYCMFLVPQTIQPVYTHLDTVVFDRFHCAAPTVQQTVRCRSVWDSMDSCRPRASWNMQSRNVKKWSTLRLFPSPHGVLKCKLSLMCFELAFAACDVHCTTLHNWSEITDPLPQTVSSELLHSKKLLPRWSLSSLSNFDRNLLV